MNRDLSTEQRRVVPTTISWNTQSTHAQVLPLNTGITSVANVPSKILASIFHAYRALVSRISEFVTVSHVCRTWRTAALEDASLWGYLDTIMGEQWLRESVERSKQAPLSIDLELSAEMAEPFKDLLPHIWKPSRLRCVRLTGDLAFLHPLAVLHPLDTNIMSPPQPIPFPLLETLILWSSLTLPTSLVSDSSDMSLTPRLFPQLRALEVVRAGWYPRFTSPFPNLRRLKLACDIEIDISYLLDILPKLPQLVDLDLEFNDLQSMQHGHDTPASVLRLPTLKSLKLTSSCHGDLVGVINALSSSWWSTPPDCSPAQLPTCPINQVTLSYPWFQPDLKLAGFSDNGQTSFTLDVTLPEFGSQFDDIPGYDQNLVLGAISTIFEYLDIEHLELEGELARQGEAEDTFADILTSFDTGYPCIQSITIKSSFLRDFLAFLKDEIGEQQVPFTRDEAAELYMRYPTFELLTLEGLEGASVADTEFIEMFAGRMLCNRHIIERGFHDLSEVAEDDT
ncbi:hypothetical protein CC2G_002436 [Coprinopsis cinerea AmutBmut pab1-1]|nr:hypothetical protein CC2G_002436 [Coprinopsis cinerea AmutBmut pab1-1]